tara:strand:- start:249 stop:449 length:201 start_codon:yes stop_codon:yes gene_type:complete
MDKKRTTKEKTIKKFTKKHQKFFHEEWAEQEKLLELSYKESIRQREERKKKSESQKLQDELEPIDG